MIRILVVGEQTPGNDEVKSITELLDQKGYTFSVASKLDGQTSRMGGGFPDLILAVSDIEHTLAAVESNPYLIDTPVLAVVDDLNSAEKLLGLGAYDLIETPTNQVLLAKRIENCAKTRDLAAQFEGAKKQMREMTMYDSLTDLLTRRYFLSQALRELARALRFGHSYSMIIVEPDHFKQINDEKGSDAGDEVLKHLANICSDMARQIDMVGRLSGSEFVICCAETGSGGARVVADRILAKVEKSVIPTPAGAVEYSVSIGVSQLGPLEMDISPLLQRADSALVDAKARGGDQVGVELLPEED
ncbi:MAG: GGDEF domain-containing protein [Pseudomonadales bacterium]|nr:GGDEF domain-containing protein [Pseudomonadales bacterium]